MSTCHIGCGHFKDPDLDFPASTLHRRIITHLPHWAGGGGIGISSEFNVSRPYLKYPPRTPPRAGRGGGHVVGGGDAVFEARIKQMAGPMSYDDSNRVNSAAPVQLP